MRSITIRKIPDETYRILKRQAVDRDIPLGIYMLQIVDAHVRNGNVCTDADLPQVPSMHALPSTDSPVTDTPEQKRKGEESYDTER